MKLQCIVLLLFPIFLFGQTPRIAVLESDSILVQSQWYALLKVEAQTLADFVQDSILKVEVEKYTLRYTELMDEYERYSCTGYSPKREKEMEQELQERQESLEHLAKVADEVLFTYENGLLEFWKQELLIVVDSLATIWKYDFVLPKEMLVFLSPENAKEQALFEQAVLKVLNQRIGEMDKKDWQIKSKAFQKECLEKIQKEIYVLPIDVQKELSKLDVFRIIALCMHGAKLT